MIGMISEYGLLTETVIQMAGFGIVAFVLLMIVGQWIKNNNAPICSVKAVVCRKDAEVTQHQIPIAPDGSPAQGYSISISENLFIQFETEAGEQLTFSVDGTVYRQIQQGDIGLLQYQGTRFLGFHIDEGNGGEEHGGFE